MSNAGWAMPRGARKYHWFYDRSWPSLCNRHHDYWNDRSTTVVRKAQCVTCRQKLGLDDIQQLPEGDR